MVAQFVHILYNIVDRIYIGHLPENGALALTGLGLTFPMITLGMAFTQLIATGATPLFSIARGARNEERAETILNQAIGMTVLFSAFIFLLCYFFRRPLLFLFGASEASYVFADQYLRIYLLGTWFSMFATSINSFISAQGFPKTGMMTTLIGAVLNIALDPLFIFVFGMGVSGAALATIISQGVSAGWVLLFLLGKKSMYRPSFRKMLPCAAYYLEVIKLGIAGFVMQATNCLVQVTSNAMLRKYGDLMPAVNGGDIYVGVMTILNSVRELFLVPSQSITVGSQPVLGFNYGAKKYSRVRQGIVSMSVLTGIYMIAIWLTMMLFPGIFVSLFTTDAALKEAGTHAIRLYFSAFVFMVMMSAGQSTFTALNHPKRAILFSVTRKAIIEVPLSLILPSIGFGVNGVFMAEPISNIIVSVACFTTMILTVYRKLPKEDG